LELVCLARLKEELDFKDKIENEEKRKLVTSPSASPNKYSKIEFTSDEDKEWD
jgi:hypothetical protein